LDALRVDQQLAVGHIAPRLGGAQLTLAHVAEHGPLGLRLGGLGTLVIEFECLTHSAASLAGARAGRAISLMAERRARKCRCQAWARLIADSLPLRPRSTS